MDSTTRLVTKAFSWQVAGLITMTLIGLLFTGSISASGGIAIVGSLTGFVTYFLHELLWARVRWGKLEAPKT